MAMVTKADNRNSLTAQYPPPITFKISNRVHFNTLFHNGMIRGLHLAFQYIGKNNRKGVLVVDNASMSGLDPFEFIPIYVVIKHGVVGLTKTFGVGCLCFVSSYIFAKRSNVKPYTAAHMLHIRSITKCEGRSETPQPPQSRIFRFKH